MSDEKSVEIISLLESSEEIISLLDDSVETCSVNENSEEIKLFLDNCFGEDSSSVFDKLTNLNNQVSLLSKENSQYKSEVKDVEKFISSISSGKKRLFLKCFLIGVYI